MSFTMKPTALFKLILTTISFFISLSSVFAQPLPSKINPAPSSLEVNVLWPFLPGGISEFRYLVPISNINHRSYLGELVLGVYSDFASKIVRDSSYGKVSYYAFKIGYRQFFTQGWHAEMTTNIGWRSEVDRPGAADNKIEGVAARLWTFVGYQHNFCKIFYSNFRVGLGNHLYRSDSYAETEKRNVFGLDVNLGVNF